MVHPEVLEEDLGFALQITPPRSIPSIIGISRWVLRLLALRILVWGVLNFLMYMIKRILQILENCYQGWKCHRHSVIVEGHGEVTT